jgi:hypothetical protein
VSLAHLSHTYNPDPDHFLPALGKIRDAPSGLWFTGAVIVELGGNLCQR